ncbi:MAG: Rha family transcriptional regulator [Gallionella sp.]
MSRLTLNPSVSLVNGHVTTTSSKIAEHFGKRHDTVLRAIANLECSNEYRLRNFAETVISRENPSGGAPIQSVAYSITRDGFVFLAMGFTGKEAAQWKEAYISAFNSLEAQIQKQKEAERVALPAVTVFDRDRIERINKRAWTLAQAAFEGYCERMAEDPLVRCGSTKPEEWQPIEASKDVLELIRATATTLAAVSKNLNRRGDSLARMTGKNEG